MEPITAAPGDEAASYIEANVMGVVSEAIDRILANPPKLGTEVAVFESHLRSMNPRRQYKTRVMTLPRLPSPDSTPAARAAAQLAAVKKAAAAGQEQRMARVATSNSSIRANLTTAEGHSGGGVVGNQSVTFPASPFGAHEGHTQTTVGRGLQLSVPALNSNTKSNNSFNNGKNGLPTFSVPTNPDGTAAMGGNNYSPPAPTNRSTARGDRGRNGLNSGHGFTPQPHEIRALPTQFTLKFNAVNSGKGGGTSASVQLQRRREEEQLRRMGIRTGPNEARGGHMDPTRQHGDADANTSGGGLGDVSPILSNSAKKKKKKSVNVSVSFPATVAVEGGAEAATNSAASTPANVLNQTPVASAMKKSGNEAEDEEDEEVFFLDKCKELPVFVGEYPWSEPKLKKMIHHLHTTHQMRHITFVVASTPSIAVKLDDGFVYRAEVEPPLWNLATRQLVEEVLLASDPKSAALGRDGGRSSTDGGNGSEGKTSSDDEASSSSASGRRSSTTVQSPGTNSSSVRLSIRKSTLANANIGGGGAMDGEGEGEGLDAAQLARAKELGLTPKQFGLKIHADRLKAENAVDLLADLGIDPKVMADAEYEEADRARRVENARRRTSIQGGISKLKNLVENVMENRRKTREQIAQGLHVNTTKAEILLGNETVNTNALLQAIDDERLESALIKYLFPVDKKKLQEREAARDKEQRARDSTYSQQMLDKSPSFFSQQQRRSISHSVGSASSGESNASPTTGSPSSRTRKSSRSPSIFARVASTLKSGANNNGNVDIFGNSQKSRSMSTATLSTNPLLRAKSFGLAETALRAARERRAENEMRLAMSVTSSLMTLRDAARSYVDENPSAQIIFKYHRLYHPPGVPVSHRATDRLFEVLSTVPKEHDACVVVLGFNQSVLLRHIASLCSIYFKIVREVQVVSRAFTLFDVQERVTPFVDVESHRRRLARNRAERDQRRAQIAEELRPKIRAIEQVESPQECKLRLEKARQIRNSRIERRQRNDEALNAIEFVQQYNAAVKIQSSVRGWLARRFVNAIIEQEASNATNSAASNAAKSREAFQTKAQLIYKEFREGKNPFFTKCVDYLLDNLGEDMIAKKAPSRAFNRTLVLHERRRVRVPPANDDDISSEDDVWSQKTVTHVIPGTTCPMNPSSIVISALQSSGCDDLSYLVEVIAEYSHVEPMQRKASAIMEKLVQYIMFAAFASLRIKLEFGYAATPGSMASSVFLQVPQRFQHVTNFSLWSQCLPLPTEWSRQFSIFAHVFSKEPAPLLSHRVLIGGPLPNGAWVADEPEEENPAILAAQLKAQRETAMFSPQQHNANNSNNNDASGRGGGSPPIGRNMSMFVTPTMLQTVAGGEKGAAGGGRNGLSFRNAAKRGTVQPGDATATAAAAGDHRSSSVTHNPLDNSAIASNDTASTPQKQQQQRRSVNNSGGPPIPSANKDDYCIVCPRRVEKFDASPNVAAQAPVFIVPEFLTDVQWEETARRIFNGDMSILGLTQFEQQQQMQQQLTQNASNSNNGQQQQKKDGTATDRGQHNNTSPSAVMPSIAAAAHTPNNKKFNRIVWVSTCPHPCVVINGNPFYLPERKSTLQRHCINNPIVKDARAEALKPKPLPEPLCSTTINSFAPPSSVPPPRDMGLLAVSGGLGGGGGGGAARGTSIAISDANTAAAAGSVRGVNLMALKNGKAGGVPTRRTPVLLCEAPLLSTAVTKEDRPTHAPDRLLLSNGSTIPSAAVAAAPQGTAETLLSSTATAVGGTSSVGAATRKKPHHLYLAEIEASLITELVEQVQNVTGGQIEYYPAAASSAREPNGVVGGERWPSLTAAYPSSPSSAYSILTALKPYWDIPADASQKSNMRVSQRERGDEGAGGEGFTSLQQQDPTTKPPTNASIDVIGNMLGELGYDMIWGGIAPPLASAISGIAAPSSGVKGGGGEVGVETVRPNIRNASLLVDETTSRFGLRKPSPVRLRILRGDINNNNPSGLNDDGNGNASSLAASPSSNARIARDTAEMLHGGGRGAALLLGAHQSVVGRHVTAASTAATAHAANSNMLLTPLSVVTAGGGGEGAMGGGAAIARNNLLNHAASVVNRKAGGGGGAHRKGGKGGGGGGGTTADGLLVTGPSSEFGVGGASFGGLNGGGSIRYAALSAANRLPKTAADAITSLPAVAARIHNSLRQMVDERFGLTDNQQQRDDDDIEPNNVSGASSHTPLFGGVGGGHPLVGSVAAVAAAAAAQKSGSISSNCFKYHRIPLKYGHMAELATCLGDLYELIVANADEPRTAFVFSFSDPFRSLLATTASTIIYDIDLRKSYQRAELNLTSNNNAMAAGNTNSSTTPRQQQQANTARSGATSPRAGGGGDDDGTFGSAMTSPKGGAGHLSDTANTSSLSLLSPSVGLRSTLRAAGIHSQHGSKKAPPPPPPPPLPKRPASNKPSALDMFPFLARVADENIGIEIGRASTALDEILVDCEAYDAVIGDAARSVFYSVLANLPDEESLMAPTRVVDSLSLDHMDAYSGAASAAGIHTVVGEDGHPLPPQKPQLSPRTRREINRLEAQVLRAEEEERKMRDITMSLPQLRYTRRILMEWLDALKPDGWVDPTATTTTTSATSFGGLSHLNRKAAAPDTNTNNKGNVNLNGTGVLPSANSPRQPNVPNPIDGDTKESSKVTLSPFGPIIPLDDAARRFECYFTLVLFTSFVRLSCDVRRVNAATGKPLPRFEEHIFAVPMPSSSSSTTAASGNGAGGSGLGASKLGSIFMNAMGGGNNKSTNNSNGGANSGQQNSGGVNHQLLESIRGGVDMWEAPIRLTGEGLLENAARGGGGGAGDGSGSACSSIFSARGNGSYGSGKKCGSSNAKNRSGKGFGLNGRNNNSNNKNGRSQMADTQAAQTLAQQEAQKVIESMNANTLCVEDDPNERKNKRPVHEEDAIDLTVMAGGHLLLQQHQQMLLQGNGNSNRSRSKSISPTAASLRASVAKSPTLITAEALAAIARGGGANNYSSAAQQQRSTNLTALLASAAQTNGSGIAAAAGSGINTLLPLDQLGGMLGSTDRLDEDGNPIAEEPFEEMVHPLATAAAALARPHTVFDIEYEGVRLWKTNQSAMHVLR